MERRTLHGYFGAYDKSVIDVDSSAAVRDGILFYQE